MCSPNHWGCANQCQDKLGVLHQEWHPPRQAYAKSNMQIVKETDLQTDDPLWRSPNRQQLKEGVKEIT